MSLVLDASLTLSWCFADERTTAGWSVLTRVAGSGAEVPSLWHLEVLNGLLVAERRRRIDVAGRNQRLALLRGLPIAVDTETPAQAWNATLALAERHALTLYDAAYLELALRRGLPLASLDDRLRVAAEAAGVACLGR